MDFLSRQSLQNLKSKKSKFNSLFQRKDVDYSLLSLTVILSILGILIISSATRSYESHTYVRIQLIATILGLISSLILMFIDYRIWKKFYLPLYILCNILLILTLVLGFGENTWGSRSWLKLGPISFQPAEIVKIALVICFSAWLDDHKERINEIKVLLQTIIFAGIPIFLILLQPDFGTAMVFIFYIAVMIFYEGIDWKYILGALGIIILSFPLLYSMLGEYQKARILNFLNPGEDISGSGYQVYEGRIAIGSGRLTGRGLYKGPQTQYNFIPTKETDFIFPVLVEELGFLGGAFLILLYGLMLFQMLKTLRLTKNEMGKSLIIGFVSIFFIHIWENIGMTLGLMPVTGIPLPFVSYGGTFQLVNFIMVGLILSVRYHHFHERDGDFRFQFEDTLQQRIDRAGEYFDRKLQEKHKKFREKKYNRK